MSEKRTGKKKKKHFPSVGYRYRSPCTEEKKWKKKESSGGGKKTKENMRIAIIN